MVVIMIVIMTVTVSMDMIMSMMMKGFSEATTLHIVGHKGAIDELAASVSMQIIGHVV
eukprot:CAMPEP_0196819304 /NCGR_PEP_ID=MMETSP1362-20130617/69985_1 /TAXON_ID=163516 /ORGANISM="Leptocylindrus danicus, Strain CCMP1856" /LENGTH=57 /DNA_ID=CAMNT_0042197747 /DNA_START=81 /DNA_END=251 /DNA_ORIENTATION=+